MMNGQRYLRVMELSDLLEISKNQFFVVGDDFRWFRIFDGFYVIVNDMQ